MFGQLNLCNTININRNREWKKKTFWTKQKIVCWTTSILFYRHISNDCRIATLIIIIISPSHHSEKKMNLFSFSIIKIGWHNTWCEQRETRRILNGEPGNDSDAYIYSIVHPNFAQWKNKENTNFRKWFIKFMPYVGEHVMDVCFYFAFGMCG